MPIHYNRKSENNKRKELRNNATPAEKKLWFFLKGSRMLGYKFRRQFSVDCFIMDFYCTELKLAIEVDGGVHDSPEAQEYDIEREKYIMNYGVQFLRITNEEIYYNIEKVNNKIENHIEKILSDQKNQ